MKNGIPASQKTQFAISLALMLPWPVGTIMIQPFHQLDGFEPTDYLIYLIGLFWTLIWEPVRRIQLALPDPANEAFTFILISVLVLMWLVVAALPLISRWRNRALLGLWSMQFAYAGAQAISGYFYARIFLA